jgi:hypothetical protein
MNGSQVAFDSVIVTTQGQRRRLSVDAFLALPLNERIVSILQRQVEFFAAGDPVDRELALRSLRVASTARS